MVKGSILSKFVLSTLLQFTKCYEWMHGYRQWWIFVCEKFCALIPTWLNASHGSKDGIRLNRLRTV